MKHDEYLCILNSILDDTYKNRKNSGGGIGSIALAIKKGVRAGWSLSVFNNEINKKGPFRRWMASKIKETPSVGTKLIKELMPVSTEKGGVNPTASTAKIIEENQLSDLQYHEALLPDNIYKYNSNYGFINSIEHFYEKKVPILRDKSKRASEILRENIEQEIKQLEREDTLLIIDRNLVKMKNAQDDVFKKWEKLKSLSNSNSDVEKAITAFDNVLYALAELEYYIIKILCLSDRLQNSLDRMEDNLNIIATNMEKTRLNLANYVVKNV